MTLHLGDGLGAFPDAVSERAVKHVQALAQCAQAGLRAVLVFCVQHSAIDRVQTADHIDPRYGEAVRAAVADGVEVLALGANLSRSELTLNRQVPFER